MKRYMLCKIKPGKTQVWLDWCNEINSNYRDEGLRSIMEENLILEKCTILHTQEDDYVIYEHETRGEDTKKPANMEKEMNVLHFQKFHECLEVINAKNIPGYTFENKNGDSFN
jgi:hypothetical protein